MCRPWAFDASSGGGHVVSSATSLEWQRKGIFNQECRKIGDPTELWLAFVIRTLRMAIRMTTLPWPMAAGWTNFYTSFECEGNDGSPVGADTWFTRHRRNPHVSLMLKIISVHFLRVTRLGRVHGGDPNIAKNTTWTGVHGEELLWVDLRAGRRQPSPACHWN